MSPLVHSVFMLAVTITFVLFMAFNIEGNDVANSFAAILDVLSTGEINAKAAVPASSCLPLGCGLSALR